MIDEGRNKKVSGPARAVLANSAKDVKDVEDVEADEVEEGEDVAYAHLRGNSGGSERVRG